MRPRVLRSAVSSYRAVFLLPSLVLLASKSWAWCTERLKGGSVWKHIRTLILIGADSLLSCRKKTKGSRALSEKDDRGSWCPDCSFPEASYLLKSRGIKAAFWKYFCGQVRVQHAVGWSLKVRRTGSFVLLKKVGIFQRGGLSFFLFVCFYLIENSQAWAMQRFMLHFFLSAPFICTVWWLLNVVFGVADML